MVTSQDDKCASSEGFTTRKRDVIDEVAEDEAEISAVLEAGFQTGVGMVLRAARQRFSRV